MITFKEVSDVKPPKPKQKTKVVRTKRSDPTHDSGLQTKCEPGDNKKFVAHALSAWDLPPINIKDDNEVEARIKLYFDYCEEHDIKPQVVAMANWLGISRSTLSKWRTGQTSGHTKSIEKAYMVLESLWADYMLNGKVNPVSGIFLAKTWYGYREQTEYVVTPGRAEEVSEDALIAEAKLISENDSTIIEARIVDE